ncbi:unnamed protein product [Closterium sp. NIES-64]|nr:unnamed protein product [Closterium sp. NIES-64]
MSSAIDVASPDEIVRIFRACDAQLFAGYAGFPGLMEEERGECRGGSAEGGVQSGDCRGGSMGHRPIGVLDQHTAAPLPPFPLQQQWPFGKSQAVSPPPPPRLPTPCRLTYLLSTLVSPARPLPAPYPPSLHQPIRVVAQLTDKTIRVVAQLTAVAAEITIRVVDQLTAVAAEIVSFSKARNCSLPLASPRFPSPTLPSPSLPLTPHPSLPLASPYTPFSPLSLPFACGFVCSVYPIYYLPAQEAPTLFPLPHTPLSFDHITPTTFTFPFQDSAVVVSGAGTSGRIAFQAQEGAEDNQEAAEAALRRVEGRGVKHSAGGRGGQSGGSSGGSEASGSKRQPVGEAIGISCGLSAPYVAAQVKYALSQSHYAVAVTGFNPPSFHTSSTTCFLRCPPLIPPVRPVTVALCRCSHGFQSALSRAKHQGVTFQSVLQELRARIDAAETDTTSYCLPHSFLSIPNQGAPGVTFPSVLSEMRARIEAAEAEGTAPRHFILSPAVGPVGSTRLKGGTATKVLLETIFSRAFARVLRLPALGSCECWQSNELSVWGVGVSRGRGAAVAAVPSYGDHFQPFPAEPLPECCACLPALRSYAGVPVLLINPPPELTPEATTWQITIRYAGVPLLLINPPLELTPEATKSAPSARQPSSRAHSRRHHVQYMISPLPCPPSHPPISDAGVPLLLINPPPELTPDDTTSVRRAARVGWGRTEAAPAARYGDVMAAYEGAMRGVYQQLPGIVALTRLFHHSSSTGGRVMHLANDSLTLALTRLFHRAISTGGRVMYIGDDSLGLVGLIDASEQVPTFGARPGSFQGFLTSTWHRLIRPLNQHTVDPLGSSAASGSSSSSSSSSRRSKAGAREGTAVPCFAKCRMGWRRGRSGRKRRKGRRVKWKGVRRRGEEEGREEDEEGEEEGGDQGESGAGGQGEEGEEGVGEGGEEGGEEDEEEEGGSSDPGVLVGRELQEERLAVAKEKADGASDEGIEEDSEEGSEWESVDGDETEHVLHSSSATGQASESTQKPLGDLPFSSFPSSLSSSSSTSSSSSMSSYFSSPSSQPLTPTFLHVTISLPAPSAAPLLPRTDLFAQLAVKLALNVASSGAHVLLGKVYSNRMVDLRVSNEKLFKRAVRVVGELAGVGAEEAERCVRRAIVIAEREEGMEGREGMEERAGRVKGEVGDDEGVSMGRKVEEMVRVGAKMERIVPTAILLAAGCFGDAESARNAALSNRSVRMLVADALNRKT